MKMLPFSSVSIQLARRPKEMQGCLPPTSGCLLATDQFPVLGILNQVNTSESPVYLHVCLVQGAAKSQHKRGRSLEQLPIWDGNLWGGEPPVTSRSSLCQKSLFAASGSGRRMANSATKRLFSMVNRVSALAWNCPPRFSHAEARQGHGFPHSNQTPRVANYVKILLGRREHGWVVP